MITYKKGDILICIPLLKDKELHLVTYLGEAMKASVVTHFHGERFFGIKYNKSSVDYDKSYYEKVNFLNSNIVKLIV